MRIIILITLALLITAVLIYRKNRFKPELLVWLLCVFLIMTMLSTFYYFTSHAEVWILIPIYAVILILIFFGVGKRMPIQTWKKMFNEYRKYLYGDELENKKGFEFIYLVNKKAHFALKRYWSTVILGAAISTLLYIGYIVWKIYLKRF